MNGSFLTPGVYTRAIPQRPAPRPPLSSVTGFVGLAVRGPINSPQRLENWGQFETIFGPVTADYDLGPAVHGFFANGGIVCYAVRVADLITTPSRPSRARWRVTDAGLTELIVAEAMNEGEWANELELRLARSPVQMTLTALTLPATAAANEIEVGSTVDFYASAPVTLIAADDPRARIVTAVQTVLSATRLRLTGTLGRPLPPGSTVQGHGLDFTATDGRIAESFTRLALRIDHPRYLVDVVNGDPEPSYVVRMARRSSVLVRVGTPATPVTPPLVGVDLPRTISVPVTFVVPAFPAAYAARLRVIAGPRLELTGAMTPAERAELLELSTETAYHAAIRRLNTLSQAFELTSSGTEPLLPMAVGFYTGYGPGGYFPHVDPLLQGYQGLAALEAVEEASLVAIPDLGRARRPREEDPPRPAADPWEPYVTGQLHMLEHCARLGERFAILDAPPQADDAADPAGALMPSYIGQLRLHPDSPNGALYFPRLRALQFPRLDPTDGGSAKRFVPPCGVVAGNHARADAAEGVHRSAANDRIEQVVETQFAVDDAGQERLNEAHINCIRAFMNRGIRVWGGRTLSSDPLWRYVAVRRTMLIIKKEIQRSLSWTTFEGNDTKLRRDISTGLTSYLDGLFQSGVLAGNSREEAYFVRCNDETNAPDAFERGEIVAELGFAPLYPAEFIVATVRRTADAINVTTAS